MNLKLIKKIDNNISNILAKGYEDEEFIIEDYLTNLVQENENSVYTLLKLIIVKLEIPILDYEGAIALSDKGLSIDKNINFLLLKFYGESFLGLNSYILDVNSFESKTKKESALLDYMKAVYYEKDINKSVELLMSSLSENPKLPVAHLLLIKHSKNNVPLLKIHYAFLKKEVKIFSMDDIYNRDYYSVDNFINEKILLLEMTQESFEIINKNNPARRPTD